MYYMLNNRTIRFCFFNYYYNNKVRFKPRNPGEGFASTGPALFYPLYFSELFFPEATAVFLLWSKQKPTTSQRLTPLFDGKTRGQVCNYN